MAPPFRIGTGYDIHRFAAGRALILGGVNIPHHQGLDGHSDADSLTHAIADALLGAAGLPDIGHYFPPGDPAFKDINSQIILKRVVQELDNAGYGIGNIDATVIAEAPRIGPYIPSMKKALGATLQIAPEAIGIKATTNEKLGDIGRGQGIAAIAVCLLLSK